MSNTGARKRIRALKMWLVATISLVGIAGAMADPDQPEVRWRDAPVTEAAAQVHSRTLHLPAGKFDTRGGILESSQDLRLGQSEKLRPGVPWIVQFQKTHGRAERDELNARGFEVHAYVPDNAYLVRGADMITLVELPGVVWAGPLHPGYRMTPDLLTELDAAGEPLLQRVVLLEPGERGRVTAALMTAGAAMEEAILPPGDLRIYFTGGSEVSLAAARLDGVRQVELVPTDYVPLNEESRRVIQSGSSGGEAIYNQSGITGTGQVVGLMDEGVNLDTLLLSDTDLQAGSAGPTHRKIYDYSPFWGDFETCACPAAGGYSHGTMAA